MMLRSLLALSVAFLALGSRAPDDGYYSPIVKFKRELESLREARAKVQAQYEEAAAAIRKDPAGFYKAHSSECEPKGPKRADGSFDYVYLPAREWVEHKKGLTGKIAEKTRELLEAYDEAIKSLEEEERHSLKRWQAWGEAVTRLKANEKDLKAWEEEYRKTMLMAGWDFANEFVPAMREGLGKLGIRLFRPPPGSFWSKVSPETRSILRHRLDDLENASSLFLHATKAIFAGNDSLKEKDADEASRKLLEYAENASLAAADMLKEVAVGTTKAELEEYDKIVAALTAYIKIVRAGSEIARGKKLDYNTKIALSEAGVEVLKFALLFNPCGRAAVMAYKPLAAGAETLIAVPAWWSNWSAKRENESDLDWARRMTAAAREDQEKATELLRVYREERAALAASQGK